MHQNYRFPKSGQIFFNIPDNLYNKELVDGYDTNMRALVVAVIEHESRFQGNVGGKYRGLMQIKLLFDIKHRLTSFNIIDILL